MINERKEETQTLVSDLKEELKELKENTIKWAQRESLNHFQHKNEEN
jgi:hypothetical protein